MKIFFARLRARRLRPLVFASAVITGLVGAPVLTVSEAAAQAIPAAYGRQAIVVRGDLGGDVGARANKIQAMAAAGQTVAIKGACYSSCTMYLGLPGSCVTRNSSFGFHRPSFYGAALPPKKFEFWSQLIAAHYPPALKSWYLREGRYSVNLKMISGAQLIRLGVPECS
ncbi:hypothetical protein C8J27_101789 [Rhodobacter aestuarii]|uniref:Uncharacterized protein n=1 Tax=Rhodobacter aestuarii TaxID=453582 RepID=A0A1N7P8X0_9RHOB|nr:MULTISPECIES: hypothetical protein [Rhodobacter]PTV97672.1 hypothetical protein C8J27_101789 [Rhodobacter aestuarii]SIT07085.1 hypothetical protein SAMN05421580_109149 [Rhodobacter aestuarii]SOC04716.1 hypothetical protein SAMN05877809_103276 [Rhodobacter sp. JA431]